MTAWPAELRVRLPDWIEEVADRARVYRREEEQIALAVELARQNVERRTGGPFGAAIFEVGSGRLVGVGVNLVTGHRNSTLHAEMVAFMTAQAAVGSHTLHQEGGPEHLLATSCEPCAMCLGGALWSGVRRIASAAHREDALALGFDEGPVFEASYRYLEERGIAFHRGVGRTAAREVMARYLALGGPVYNP